MRATRRLLLALMVTTSAVSARAAEPEPAPAGTDAGASELRNALAAYVGRSAIDAGVLRIATDPAGYRVTLDVSKVLPPLLPPETKVEIAPYDVILSQRQDGNWNVFSGSAPSISYSVRSGEVSQSGTYTQEGANFKGVFSPEIRTFVSGAGGLTKMRTSTTDAFGTSTSEFGPSTFEMTGAKAEDGAADLTFTSSTDSFTERREFRGADMPPEATTPIVVKGGKVQSVFTATALRSRALIDLQAFFVAHPDLLGPRTDTAASAPIEGELKTLLRAALPLWRNMNASSRIDGMSGETGYGTFTARSLDYAVSLDGLTKDAKMAMTASMAGFDLVSPLVPAWTKGLIPQDVDLRFGIEKLDLRTPTEIAIEDFRLNGAADQFDAIGRKAGEAFEAAPPTFTIEPSRIRSADLELKLNGALVLAEAKPAVSLSVEATGLDRTIENLRTAAEKAPEAHQVIGMLSIAKGFGKALPGGQMQWVVNVQPDGSVKVNGVEVKGPTVDDTGDADMPDEGIAPDGDVPLDQAPTDDNALPDAAPRP